MARTSRGVGTLATVPDQRARSSASRVGGSYGSGGGTDRAVPSQTASGGQDPPPGDDRPAAPPSPGRSSGPLDPPGDDDLSAVWPEPEIEDEPGSLTLDDLKKAPPEYANLPGPRDPASAGPRARPDPPVAGPPATPPGSPHVQVVAGSTGAEPPPSLAEVEAMAESLAQEFRSSPTDDVGGPAASSDPFQRAPEAEPPAARSAPRDPQPPPFDDDLVGEFEAPEPHEPATKRATRTVKVGAPEDLIGSLVGGSDGSHGDP